MAIYKPSNCVPFLTPWDLTKPHDISCELSTSNENVTGYKIKILDSDNELIFQGAHFTPIPQDEGLNGSTLTVPLIVTDENELDYNTIYYGSKGFSSDKKWYYKNNLGVTTELQKFVNNYPKQPYKWQIILAQGQYESGNFVEIPTEANRKYYDMLITSGTVIGSNGNRIQSDVSDYIFKDYFLELLDYKQDPIKSTYRVLIKNYDHTFGYIYPQEGKLTNDQVLNDADYFRIYKKTNDPSVISAGEIVSLAVQPQMGSIQVGGKSNMRTWGPSEYPYYFEQVYIDPDFTDPTSGKPNPNNFYDSEMTQPKVWAKWYDSDDTLKDSVLPIGTIVLVKNEAISAYNGVFRLTSVTYGVPQDSTDTTTKVLKIQWLRSTPGDTWGSLVNSVYQVTAGADAGKRFQCVVGDNAVGTINYTDINIQSEQAIEIYPGITIGNIFKNRDGLNYIRPFVGIEDNMLFTYFRDPGIGSEQFVYGATYDTTRWSVSGSPQKLRQLGPDESTYKIYSYFKISDENPFYAYATPELSIKWDNNGVLVDVSSDSTQMTEIPRRKVTFVGEFVQENNKPWVSYQWYLFDLTTGLEDHTEKTYDGEIRTTFNGLQKDHVYQITLIVEDEFGKFYKKDGYVLDNITINPDTTINFEPVFDCDTQSFIIDFKKTGVVVPSFSDVAKFLVRESISPASNKINFYTVDSKLFLVRRTGNYTIDYYDGYMTVGDLTDRKDIPTDAISYQNTKIEQDGTEGKMLTPTENTCTLNSQHKLGNNFSGNIISYSIDTEDFLGQSAKLILTVNIPPVYDKNGNLNPERYYIKAICERVLGDGTRTTIAQQIRKFSMTDKGIVSAWIETGGTANPEYAYLDTKEVYGQDGKTILSGYSNIRGENTYNSNKGVIPFPLQNQQGSGGDYNTVWIDEETETHTQANGNTINIIKNNAYKQWYDSGYWSDNSTVETYKQEKIKDSSIRSITAPLFLNIVLKDYDVQISGATFNNDNLVFHAFYNGTELDRV